MVISGMLRSLYVGDALETEFHILQACLGLPVDDKPTDSHPRRLVFTLSILPTLFLPPFRFILLLQYHQHQTLLLIMVIINDRT
jgi:hypothetical protein